MKLKFNEQKLLKFTSPRAKTSSSSAIGVLLCYCGCCCVWFDFWGCKCMYACLQRSGCEGHIQRECHFVPPQKHFLFRRVGWSAHHLGQRSEVRCHTYIDTYVHTVNINKQTIWVYNNYFKTYLLFGSKTCIHRNISSYVILHFIYTYICACITLSLMI